MPAQTSHTQLVSLVARGSPIYTGSCRRTPRNGHEEISVMSAYSHRGNELCVPGYRRYELHNARRPAQHCRYDLRTTSE